MTQDRETELLREIDRLNGELAAEKNKLDLVLQSIVDGVYMTDLERGIIYWNKGAERITGFRSVEVQGKLCRTLLAHTDESGNSLCDEACPLVQTMSSKDPIFSKDVFTKTAGGTLKPVSVSCAPLVGLDGQVVGAIEVFRDISAKKELEKQKAALASMVTHDLKTPLMLILGYTDLLLDMDKEKACESMTEYLTSIRAGGDRLHSMIEDFLSISRIGAGNMQVNIHPVIIGDLLNKLYSDFSVAANNKGLVLDYETPRGLPIVRLDIKLIERTIANLLGNAVNYTPAGGRVAMSAKAATLRQGDVEADGVSITISDTGPGIPAEELAQIFEMYYRAGSSFGTRGSGLGLTIVKTFVEEHGGTVSVVSEVGSGSSFTITLPCVPHGPETA